MTASDWTLGYNSSVDYTFEFQRYLNPDRLILACVMQGLQTSASILSGGEVDTRGLVYCELGCGQGLTLNMMAARDPGGRYIGIDYNPNQIAYAREFAKAGGIGNIEFLEQSFEDLMTLDIPDCDIIVMHGIWSWISKDLQDRILDFMRRKLKPGGICYVSYNCMTGRNDFPLRELLRVAERTSRASGEERVDDAIDFALKVADAGAGYFKRHPVAKEHLEELTDYPAHYTIHEYLNENWSPAFFHDVARRMGEAKLTFAGQVDHVWNRPDLVLPPEASALRARLSSVEDTEFLKDMWYGNTFRKDLYVKGSRRLSASAIEQQIASLRFALVIKPDDVKFEIPTPRGTFKLSEQLFKPIFDRLKHGVVTGRELTVLAAEQQHDIVDVLQFLFVSGYVSLCVDKAAVDRIAKSLKNFDAAIWTGVERGDEVYIATSPGLGSATKFGFANYLMWRSAKTGEKNRVEWAFGIIKKLGRPLRLDKDLIDDDSQILAFLKEHQKKYDASIAPLIDVGM